MRKWQEISESRKQDSRELTVKTPTEHKRQRPIVMVRLEVKLSHGSVTNYDVLLVFFVGEVVADPEYLISVLILHTNKKAHWVLNPGGHRWPSKHLYLLLRSTAQGAHGRDNRPPREQNKIANSPSPARERRGTSPSNVGFGALLVARILKLLSRRRVGATHVFRS